MGGTIPSGVDLEDQYTFRVSLDSSDARSSLSAFDRAMGQAGKKVSGFSQVASTSLKYVAKSAKMLGVTLSAGALVKGMLELNDTLGSVRGGMVAASREAMRGGGAILGWAQDNAEAWDSMFKFTNDMHAKYRLGGKAVVDMMGSVARSGIVVTSGMKDQLQVVEELKAATELGFQLEFLGLAPAQIEDLYHSMAVNLKMSFNDIRDSLYDLQLAVKDTGFSFSEHMKYVTQLLNQYSKFGLGMDHVILMMKNMKDASSDAGGELKNIGLAWDVLGQRMKGATGVPTQQQLGVFLENFSTEDLATYETALTPAESKSMRTQFKMLTGGKLDLDEFIETSGSGLGGLERFAGIRAFLGAVPQDAISKGYLARIAGENVAGSGNISDLGLPEFYANTANLLFGNLDVEAGAISKGQPMLKAAQYGKLRNNPDAMAEIRAQGGGESPKDWFDELGNTYSKVQDMTTGVLRDIKYYVERMYWWLTSASRGMFSGAGAVLSGRAAHETLVNKYASLSPADKDALRTQYSKDSGIPLGDLSEAAMAEEYASSASGWEKTKAQAGAQYKWYNKYGKGAMDFTLNPGYFWYDRVKKATQKKKLLEPSDGEASEPSSMTLPMDLDVSSRRGSLGLGDGTPTKEVGGRGAGGGDVPIELSLYLTPSESIPLKGFVKRAVYEVLASQNVEQS